jgi:triacylglycerol esterase/lipase EstA (alpha/beta hydrolase family)
VERLRTRTGADTVHIIGHSLGGLVARYFVQRLGGHQTVGALVTLGTAHGGSLVANLLPATPLLRQFRPDSDIIAELDEPAPECTTRFLSVWSHADPTMVPRRTARLEHPDLDVEDIELDHVGHLSMVDDGEVLHRVRSWLVQIDRSSSPGPAA